MLGSVDISIVIVAHNQHRHLRNVLAGLDVQVMDADVSTEVIVVDNGSTPPAASCTERVPPVDRDIRFIRRDLESGFFRPASARNIAIATARGAYLIFLDGDCIPGPRFLQDHWTALTSRSQPVATLGHRVFVDVSNVIPDDIAQRSCDLSHLPTVRSESNYALALDRRLPEFATFDNHSHPYNCCHGCNFAVSAASAARIGGFDEEFDGYWGYEDIEFGFRLWRTGVSLMYLPDAYVYHQEGDGLSAHRRSQDRQRNYELACRRIPGFADFRALQDRGYYDDDYNSPTTLVLAERCRSANPYEST